MKLSKRLNTIDSMITTPYDQIWDCCCDHGFLGINLLNRRAAEQIHFVDIVPELTDKLEQTLSAHSTKSKARLSNDSSWFVHCQDVVNLPLPPTNSRLNKVLIIIAGVGGELIVEFINQIIKDHPLHRLEFILCPVHHNVKVREALSRLNLGLVNECIVKENKRFYEVIHVSSDSTKEVANIGSIMWDLSIVEHQEYLTKKIEHYQRMTRIPSKENKRTIDAYKNLIS